ncbi:hypothetical protein IEN85_16465 [Pelagicoccus sp. NFK12]|uniref:Hpr(Ser) kinase/phosphatase n=1 Tax=Pelagicoccus enzymogenes TaxID=2773457 RepID=A0A927IIR0_9BACT|nr:hypothetical protein [Pelagicoccus enzymogenes]MBD5781094.1 hypothetical protein [Pelagicoccus enzymogenes]
MSFAYRAFGLTIQSEIQLPLLQNDSDSPDIEIRYGKCPQNLGKATKHGLKFEANSDEFLLKVDGCADYYVTEGKKVTIQPRDKSESAESIVSLQLLGPVIAALLFQREELFLLHASVVARNDKAFAIAGRSGSGKSTLATALLDLGFQSLGDDVCALSFDANARPYARPSIPSAKLWKDSIELLGLEPEGLKRIAPAIEKLHFPLFDRFSRVDTPLAGIYLLTGEHGLGDILSPLSAIEGLSAIKEHQFRKIIATGESQQRHIFSRSVMLANATTIKSTHRGPKGTTLKELATHILNDTERWER